MTTGVDRPADSAEPADSAQPADSAEPADEGHAAPKRRGPGPGRHCEWAVAASAAVLLAIAMIWLVPPCAVWVMSSGQDWPGIANPFDTIIGDIGDPLAQAWLLAWNGHAVLHDLGNVWRTNAFFPENYALAFSDSLLGYAPAGVLGSGPVDAVARYNVVFVLAFALASFGGYALARQLGANRVGSAIAGAAFAYAPWRYGHDGHLNIVSTGGIALALAMLARGHGWSLTHGYRPERARPGWAVAGWLVAAWQISLGFGIGLPFFYVLAAGTLVVAGYYVAGRPAIGRRLLLCDVAGGVAFALVSFAMAYPYQRVRATYSETLRSWDYVAVFSPPPHGFLVAPHASMPWGSWHEAARTALGTAANEKTLLCGFVLYVLAAVGLFVSIWTRRQRALLAAGAALSALLALGTTGPLYRLLYLYLPGFDGSRTPGRLIVWPTLLLGLLAAGMVSELARRVRDGAIRDRARAFALLATVPLLLAVLFEGLPRMDHPDVPLGPAALAVAPAPLIVLPSDEAIDRNVMLWSTDGFPTMVNGASSINPPGHQAIRDLMQTFPSPQSIEELRRLGIRSVVVVREAVRDTPFQATLDAPIDGLGVRRQDVGADVVYTLD